jgi:hypothetical protein
MNDDSFQVSIEAFRVLLTESPHLVRIFQARWLLYHPRLSDYLSLMPSVGRKLNPRLFDNLDLMRSVPRKLFFIRILLDLSWVDMRAAICSLRPILGEDARKFGELLLALPTPFSEIYPESFTSRDLALGFLRLMRKIISGDLLMDFW